MSAGQTETYEEMFELASASSDHGKNVDEFRPALLDALASTNHGVCLEIGVQHGGSARYTMWHLQKEGGQRPFVTCDTSGGLDPKDYPAYPYMHFQMDQEEFTRKHAAMWQYAFIYHDGAHGDEPVLRDVERLAPLMVKGGMLVIDDVDQCTRVPDFTTLGLKQVTYGLPRELMPDNPAATHIGFWRKQ